MKSHLKIYIIILVLPLFLLACSGNSSQANPTVTTIQSNIIGSWVSTDTSITTEGSWQFDSDGTFTDTKGASFQYQIYQISDFNYIAFSAEDLNIEPSDELNDELKKSLGTTDFIPIYKITMPSSDSAVIEPAVELYGSNSYFGFTFQTYVLKRQ